MLTLDTRIRRLEIVTIPKPSCAICGAPNAKHTFTVHMQGYDPPTTTPERCPGCGRRQVWKIEFDKRDDHASTRAA